MQLLALDSSQSSCSIALFTDGQFIDQLTEPTPGKQVEQLIPLWQQLLDKHSLELAQIEHMVVSLGPGSFAGTRIALAACKAVALESAIPLSGITTLDAIAQPDSAALIDARRGQWFALIDNQPQLLEDGNINDITTPVRAYDPENRLSELTSQPVTQVTLDATLVGEAFIQMNYQSDAPLIPCYVRPPDAKLPTAIAF